jgi:hypothetical protein
MFAFLKMPNYPSKHWSVGWEIAKSLHNVVLSVTKEVILAFSFLSIFADEITTMDNRS